MSMEQTSPVESEPESWGDVDFWTWHFARYGKPETESIASDSSDSITEGKGPAHFIAGHRLHGMQDLIRYHFKDVKLAQQAVKMDDADNEGLAMMGTAVLNLLFLEQCYRSGMSTEDALKATQQALTDVTVYNDFLNNNYYDIIQLKEYPPAPPHEAATVVKAIIGAAYRDTGMEGARHVKEAVHRWSFGSNELSRHKQLEKNDDVALSGPTQNESDTTSSLPGPSETGRQSPPPPVSPAEGRRRMLAQYDADEAEGKELHYSDKWFQRCLRRRAEAEAAAANASSDT